MGERNNLVPRSAWHPTIRRSASSAHEFDSDDVVRSVTKGVRRGASNETYGILNLLSSNPSTHPPIHPSTRHSLWLILILLIIPSLLHPHIRHIPTDHPTIQAGINTAADGDTVLVAEGIYFENISFRGKAITVASRFLLDGDTSHIANTVIDGSRPIHPDSASVVYFISGEDTTSMLCGFTITHGSGTLTEFQWVDLWYKAQTGGGIFCDNAGARIVHNRIINNHVAGVGWALGGGVYVDSYDTLTHVILDNNHISRNSLTAIENSWGGGLLLISHATVTNNLISYNTSSSDGFAAGAVVCWSETYPRYVVLKNNRIRHNAASGKHAGFGGGINISGATSVLIIGNDISYNEVNAGQNCYGGGITLVYRTASDSIIGNTITHNRAKSQNQTHSRGGGIDLTYNSNQSTTLISGNVITHNQAWIGSAFHSYLSKAQLRDNIVKDNTDMVWEGIEPEMKHQR